MLGLLFLVGLAVALAALETLVRRLAGEHPHHAASPSEVVSVDNCRDIWAAAGNSGGFGDGGVV